MNRVMLILMSCLMFLALAAVAKADVEMVKSYLLVPAPIAEAFGQDLPHELPTVAGDKSPAIYYFN